MIGLCCYTPGQRLRCSVQGGDKPSRDFTLFQDNAGRRPGCAWDAQQGASAPKGSISFLSRLLPPAAAAQKAPLCQKAYLNEGNLRLWCV